VPVTGQARVEKLAYERLDTRHFGRVDHLGDGDADRHDVLVARDLPGFGFLRGPGPPDVIESYRPAAGTECREGRHRVAPGKLHTRMD
jgi:hypothetical protein